MGTLQENQSLNAEYERNKKEREMKEEIERLKEEYVILQNASDEVEEEKDKEIERLNNKNEELLTLYTTEREVKEDYKSIIKEVREYIEENKVDLSWFMTTDKDLKLEGISNVVSTFRLLEILDKENNNEDN